MGVRNVKRWMKIAKKAVDHSLLTAKFLYFLYVSNTYICTPTLMYGPSMLPTLNLSDDVVLIELISTRFGFMGQGDIIFVRSPQNPRKMVFKRVIGMEIDCVTFVVDPKNSYRSKTVVV